MKTTGRRACLSLGALAKNLHETNVTVSDRLVERLEKWLEPHNESKPITQCCTADLHLWFRIYICKLLNF